MTEPTVIRAPREHYCYPGSKKVPFPQAGEGAMAIVDDGLYLPGDIWICAKCSQAWVAYQLPRNYYSHSVDLSTHWRKESRWAARRRKRKAER